MIDHQQLCYFLQSLILDITLATALWLTCAPLRRLFMSSHYDDWHHISRQWVRCPWWSHGVQPLPGGWVHIRVTMPEDPSFQVCRTSYKLIIIIIKKYVVRWKFSLELYMHPLYNKFETFAIMIMIMYMIIIFDHNNNNNNNSYYFYYSVFWLLQSEVPKRDGKFPVWRATIIITIVIIWGCSVV